MIGRINESALHEALKEFYRGADGMTEESVGGFVVDVLRPTEIVEIQTRHLGALKRKLQQLVIDHHIRLVHPIAAIKHINKIDAAGKVLSRRRSPKRGRVEEAFREVSSIADLLPHSNLTVEIVMVSMTEIRTDDGRGSWRRRGISIVGRELDTIDERHIFRTASDYLRLLPDGLPDRFTNGDFCEAAGLRYGIVQPITSTLRKMGLLAIADKRGRALTYQKT